MQVPVGSNEPPYHMMRGQNLAGLKSIQPRNQILYYMHFPSMTVTMVPHTYQRENFEFKPTYTSCTSRERISTVAGTGVTSFCVYTVMVTRAGLPALIDVCKIGENSECSDIFNIIRFIYTLILNHYHTIL